MFYEAICFVVTFDNVNEYDLSKRCGGAKIPAQFESLEPRRPSFSRKILAWDSAFFTSAGILDLLNKYLNKSIEI